MDIDALEQDLSRNPRCTFDNDATRDQPFLDLGQRLPAFLIVSAGTGLSIDGVQRGATCRSLKLSSASRY